MSIRFFWCHTWGCPNYGRARTVSTGANIKCSICGADQKMAAPDEHPMGEVKP